MKKVLLALILAVSYISASDYSDGFKAYIKAKHQLRDGNLDAANKMFKEALNYFEVAAKNNNVQADIKIASIYCNGWGVEKDNAKAKFYLKKTDVIANIHIFDKCLKKLKGE